MRPEAFLVTLGSGDNPFSGKISNITSFSSWKFSLPPTSSNEDIKFDNCPRGLTIWLTFQIFSQLKEVTTTTAEINQKAFELCHHGGEILPAQLKYVPNSNSASEICHNNHTCKQSRNAIGKSVCFGWDAVFSMTEKQINENL